MPNFDGLITYCKLREQVRLKREAGHLPPWTEDPVLANYRFCQVSPWLDKTTVRMLRAVELAEGEPGWKLALLLGLRCSSLFELADLCADHPPSSVNELESTVLRCVAQHGRATTPSFSRIGPARRLVCEPAAACLAQKLAVVNVPMSKLFEAFVGLPWVGNFIAYLAARDATAIGAIDDGFVMPGPGARKGLAKCGAPETREGVAMAWEALHGQVPSWTFDMHDTQHSLCEYHKWERASNGGRKPRERLKTA